MRKNLRVALLIESTVSFGRRILQGIAHYANTYGPWTFYHEERFIDDPAPRTLKNWKPDGVIVRIGTQKLARQLDRLGVPVVDLYEESYCKSASRVLDNDRKVVQLAVDHLRECGLQNFAYTGYPDARFSLQRCRYFTEYVRQHGFSPHVHLPPSKNIRRGLTNLISDARHEMAALTEWLKKLPKPIGMMTCNDMRAQQVLTACAEEGIQVPDAIAVVGADNDDVLCDLCNPPLSSVEPNAKHIGYEAAALLSRLIADNSTAPKTILVDPLRVVVRQSTNTYALADPTIVEIVRYIREHACDGIGIKDILRHANLSRATLDRYFMTNLGRTPHEEITRVQIRRVQELLVTTDLPLKQITNLAGFRCPETLHRVFKKMTGQTPSQYRKTAYSERR